MLDTVALGGVRCVYPSAPTAPYLINQTLRGEQGGGARAYCSLLPPEFSAKGPKACGRKITNVCYGVLTELAYRLLF
jgi:hypothetical protein